MPWIFHPNPTTFNELKRHTRIDSSFLMRSVCLHVLTIFSVTRNNPFDFNDLILHESTVTLPCDFPGRRQEQTYMIFLVILEENQCILEMDTLTS